MNSARVMRAQQYKLSAGFQNYNLCAESALELQSVGSECSRAAICALSALGLQSVRSECSRAAICGLIMSAQHLTTEQGLHSINHQLDLGCDTQRHLCNLEIISILHPVLLQVSKLQFLARLVVDRLGVLLQAPRATSLSMPITFSFSLCHSLWLSLTHCGSLTLPASGTVTLWHSLTHCGSLIANTRAQHTDTQSTPSQV